MNKAFKILVLLIFSFNCVTVFAQKKKSKKGNQTQQLKPKKEAKNKKVATKNMSSKKVKREVIITFTLIFFLFFIHNIRTRMESKKGTK